MKTILILLDGLGDRSFQTLENCTPLQAAHTPNLDRLARTGSNGLFHAALAGHCLPSETAHYLMFGYEPSLFPGRGLLEAVGYDVAFQDDDVLSLAHFSGVTWKEGRPILLQSKADIRGDVQEIGRLYAAITPYSVKGIRFNLHRTGLNDGILVMSGPVSAHISDCDTMMIGTPLAEVVPMTGNPDPQKAKRTASALNRYLSHCHRVLVNHEVNRDRIKSGLPAANFLATQRAGRRIFQEPFHDKWGLKGVVIASGAIYLGLARELGLTTVKVSDGKDLGKDLRDRIRMALSDTDHDFFHVHTKAPDQAAHTKDPVRKRDVIETLDRGLDELVKAVERRDDLLAVVTADHSTPSSSALIHSGEPVPVCMVGAEVRRDAVTAFDEISAASGCLGFLRGEELMLMILNYANRSTLLGHRLGAAERRYVPQDYRPFSIR
jgi:2,3-bisphosphoglycerate-independent phosphoglycerate mutase